MIRIETAEVALDLDGVSWGYFGTGPHGLAAILADLGYFDGDQPAAIEYVATLDGSRGFRLDGSEAPR